MRGHTDGRPYKSGSYDNWRLSTARAHMAYYMLVRGGIDEKRFERVEGHADRNLKVADDPEAAQNRRIEILLRKAEAVSPALRLAAPLLALALRAAPRTAEDTPQRRPISSARCDLAGRITQGDTEAHFSQGRCSRKSPSRWPLANRKCGRSRATPAPPSPSS